MTELYPDDGVEHHQEMWWERGPIRSALIFVAGPSLAALIYFGVMAPPEYQAGAEFVIRGAEPAAPNLLAQVAGIGALGGGVSSADVRVINDYLLSDANVSVMRQSYGFRTAYSRFSLDPFFSHLSSNAPIEQAVTFWRRKVKITYDTTDKMGTFTVVAYTPREALTLAQGMLRSSEDVINAMANRDLAVINRAATQELARTEHDYNAAKEALTSLQGQRSVLQFDATTQQSIGQVAAIDAEKAKLEIDIAVAEQTYQPGAPQMIALRQRLDGLESQRAAAVERARASPGAAAEADLEQKQALLDYEFAQKAYYAAEQARMQATQQAETSRKYLVAFVPPRLPEVSNYWKRMLNVLAIAAAALVLWLIGSLIQSVVKDHVQ